MSVLLTTSSAKFEAFEGSYMSLKMRFEVKWTTLKTLSMFVKLFRLNERKKGLEFRWKDWIGVNLSGHNLSSTIFGQSEVSMEMKGDKHGLDYWNGNNFLKSIWFNFLI